MSSKPLILKKGGVAWSVWNFVEAIVLAALGVMIMINSSNADLHKLALLILSIVLIAGGSFRIIVNFLPIVTTSSSDVETKEMIRSKITYDMAITGVIELSLGIVLLLNGDALLSVAQKTIVCLIAALAITAGTALVLFSIGFMVSKFYKSYLTFFELVLGGILIALGVVTLIMCLNNEGIIVTLFFFVVGVCLIVTAIGEIATTIKAMPKRAKAKKKKESPKKEKDAIEVEAIEMKKGPEEIEEKK